MSKYIVSTMTNAVCYTIFDDAAPGIVPNVKRNIRIEGGTGIPSINSGFGEMSRDHQGTPMWTPSGTVTPVSDEDFALLQNHHVFKKHLERELVKIVGNDIVDNHKAVEKVARGMAKDDFAPLNASTVKEKANKAIKVEAAGGEGQGRI